MTDKQMGPVQLGGLLAGALLGSGIILLPPMAEARLGEWSVTAWLAILVLGAIFASIFARLAMAYPGSEGVPIAIRKAFGKKAGQLATNYIICAVCVGPVAVLMTAAEAITTSFALPKEQNPTFAAILLILSCFILMRRVTFVSTISLIASILIGVILISGSIASIIIAPVSPIPSTPADIPALGSTLLLIFWAIIGWEIIGNYSMEVRNPKRTIPLATIIAVCMISVIYLLAGWAMHSVSNGHAEPANVSRIVTPLLGNYADFSIMVVTCALCICTYLMIVGGISRLLASLAEQRKLPRVLTRTNSNGSPCIAITLFFCIHLVDILLLHTGFLSLGDIVAFANVFFISNSLVAVGAAMKIFKSAAVSIPCFILCIGFICLLAFSSIWPLGLMLGISALTLGYKKPEKHCIR
ncbi:amino acid permease [Maridesulfovibrio sp.]|uniref:APC family permease n=1 Tax=Maridesulfovibrio sp. TaxID=2795000 RepID=UPI0029F45D8C|nr:amino acid permease [Maridesulfovibrio sp.]